MTETYMVTLQEHETWNTRRQAQYVKDRLAAINYPVEVQVLSGSIYVTIPDSSGCGADVLADKLSVAIVDAFVEECSVLSPHVSAAFEKEACALHGLPVSSPKEPEPQVVVTKRKIEWNG